jgi:hypothetical protein
VTLPLVKSYTSLLFTISKIVTQEIIMSFRLTYLSKEDPASVIVARAHFYERANIGTHTLCEQESRFDNDYLPVGTDSACLEVQFVNGQGRMCIVFFEDHADHLLVKGQIADGRMQLSTVEVVKQSFFGKKRKFGLHLRKDGTLVIKALESFAWLVRDKEMEEVWVELPILTLLGG